MEKEQEEKVPLKLESTHEFDGNVLEETSSVLKTQREHLVKTVKRFKADFS